MPPQQQKRQHEKQHDLLAGELLSALGKLVELVGGFLLDLGFGFFAHYRHSFRAAHPRGCALRTPLACKRPV